MIVTYTLKPLPNAASAPGPDRRSKRRDEAWREFVAEADVPLFNTLLAG
jgi:hypothetical protein